MRRSAMVGAAIVCAAVLMSVPPPVPAIAQAPDPIRVRVMTFNIQYGAYFSTIDAVVHAIQAADADVVGIQEAYGTTRAIARRLGWYASPRLHLVSRFPIVVPGGSRVAGVGGRIPEGVWAYLLLGDGAVMAFAQTHTPSSPDGVRIVRGGGDLDDVLAAEQVRVRWLAPHLQAVAGPVGAAIPTVLLGDMNSPSHLDWTDTSIDATGWQPATIDPRGDRFPIAWPVTDTIEDAGFTDTYRASHPDPVSDPGYTWCVRSFPVCGPYVSWDRIDYVFVAGPIDVVETQIVGEGGPMTEIRSRPWPSDHRAVVSELDVDRVVPRAFVGPVGDRVISGQRVELAFAHPAAPGRTIGLWMPGDDPGDDPAVVSSPVDDAADADSIQIATAGLAHGRYEVALVDADGVIASSTVWIADRVGVPTVTVQHRRYDRGEPIGVSWTHAPGNRYDWLGLTRNCFDAARCPLRGWRYIDARIDGSALFSKASEGVWPVRPGRYAVSLCVDDDYVCVATSEVFRIERA